MTILKLKHELLKLIEGKRKNDSKITLSAYLSHQSSLSLSPPPLTANIESVYDIVWQKNLRVLYGVTKIKIYIHYKKSTCNKNFTVLLIKTLISISFLPGKKKIDQGQGNLRGKQDGPMKDPISSPNKRG